MCHCGNDRWQINLLWINRLIKTQQQQNKTQKNEQRTSATIRPSTCCSQLIFFLICWLRNDTSGTAWEDWGNCNILRIWGSLAMFPSCSGHSGSVCLLCLQWLQCLTHTRLMYTTVLRAEHVSTLGRHNRGTCLCQDPLCVSHLCCDIN